LIDIAGSKGVDVLDHSYLVTLDDVRAALQAQGMSETDIREGDAVLFRYGWSEYWHIPGKFMTNPPGIGLEVAEWLVTKRPSLFGSDSYNSEVIPRETQDKTVHQELIMKKGILNQENLIFDELVQDEVYVFMLINTPLRIVGASGSPSRPIAIK